MPTTMEAHALLEQLEAKGELAERNEKPTGGGRITRIYTEAWI